MTLNISRAIKTVMVYGTTTDGRAGREDFICSAATRLKAKDSSTSCFANSSQCKQDSIRSQFIKHFMTSRHSAVVSDARASCLFAMLIRFLCFSLRFTLHCDDETENRINMQSVLTQNKFKSDFWLFHLFPHKKGNSLLLSLLLLTFQRSR